MNDSSTAAPPLADVAVPPARWLHRCAVLMVVLTWPLIWIGGLVTTHDAGMAVPDWPTTYGYNMFLYPWETWLFGPLDLFLEHGHRQLASIVGMVAIATVAVACWSEPRRSVRWWSVVLLLAVIVQGVLGGARVVLDARTLAMIHGCVGPAFFAMCTALVVVTSRWWWQTVRGSAATQSLPRRGAVSLGASPETPSPRPSPPLRGARGSKRSRSAARFLVSGEALSAALVLLAYFQLILGAQLRHLQPDGSMIGFRHSVWMHVVMAFVVWGISGVVWWRLRRCGDMTLSRPAALLVGLVGLQIALGLGTWVAHYGWPWVLGGWPVAARYVVQAKGFAESLVITGHVATGSLILATSVLIWLRARGATLAASRRWESPEVGRQEKG